MAHSDLGLALRWPVRFLTVDGFGAASLLLLGTLLILPGCITGKESDHADLALVADGAVSADGGGGNTFSLKGTIQVAPLGGCQASDPKRDCVGNVYWGVFTEPVTNLGTAKPLFAAIVQGAKNGTPFSAAKIPWRPKLYLSAFLDDDANMVITAPLPDSGDPVFYDLAPFTAKAGQTVEHDIALLLRLP